VISIAKLKNYFLKRGWINRGGIGVAIDVVGVLCAICLQQRFAIALLSLYGYQILSQVDASYNPKTAILTYSGNQVFLEVKATPTEQAIGLQRRESLPPQSGMLFPVSPPKLVQIWTYQVKFPIDIIFLRDNQIQEIIYSTPPCYIAKTCKIHRSTNTVDTVIEVAAGTAKRLNLRVGTKIHIKFYN
jgi:uncharacterized protein